MAYADFCFYQQGYKGSAMPASVFERLSERASEYLDSITFGRITEDPTMEVRLACCAVAEELLRQEDGGMVSSESVGSWHRTYSTGDSDPDRRLYTTASQYLGRTGLLYRGWDRV